MIKKRQSTNDIQQKGILYFSAYQMFLKCDKVKMLLLPVT